MKRSEHDLSRWGVCHTSLIHFNKVYFGTIISHCVSEESFIKESVDLISLFLLEIMILLLLGNAHAQKFFFCSIVSSLAAFWRVFFFRFLGPTSFYLLEHERTERTRNLRGWKKSEADAYMMRLLLWPNGVWRRILPINATPTSWQFARVPGKRYAPTSCRAELPAAGLALASLASLTRKIEFPRRVVFWRDF